MRQGLLTTPDRRRLDAATRDLEPPFAIVDLDANAADLMRRAAGTSIRVATKSVRCRALVNDVLHRPGFRGVMAYSVAEARVADRPRCRRRAPRLSQRRRQEPPGPPRLHRRRRLPACARCSSRGSPFAATYCAASGGSGRRDHQATRILPCWLDVLRSPDRGSARLIGIRAPGQEPLRRRARRPPVGCRRGRTSDRAGRSRQWWRHRQHRDHGRRPDGHRGHGRQWVVRPGALRPLPRFQPTTCGSEGVGEVQTPVVGRAAERLRVGHRVWLRHAKAGEMGERFDVLHLVRGDRVEATVPTYRGEGRNFG